MVKQHAKLALEVFGGVFGAAALLVGAVALILARGSVELDFLAPFLATSLSNPVSGVHVTIGRVHVTLGEGPRLELVTHDIALQVGAAGPQIALPELAVDLSVRAALRGVIAPTRIVLEEPQLRLGRDETGDFHLGFDIAGGVSTDSSLGQVLHDLAGPPDPNAPIGALTELTIRRAGFLFDDRALGLSWRASADLSLHRDAHGLRGDATLANVSAAQHGQLRVEIDYVRASDRLDTQLEFRDVRPANWATASPTMAPLAELDLPITGTLRATLDPGRGEILSASCDLKLGQGAWRDASMQGGALAIADGAIVASYDPKNGRIVLDTLALGLGGPSLLARGTIDGAGGGLLAGGWPRILDAALAVDASDVPVISLPALWPPSLSPHARTWVLANVRDGAIDRASTAIGLHVDLGQADPVALGNLSGNFSYRDLTVAILGKLPPARGITGTGTFDRARMVLAPASGSVLGLAVSDAAITLSRLDQPETRAAIDLRLAGPLADALVVLDADPLGYARTLGIAPADVAGTLNARMTFEFPLVDRVDLRQVDFSADATLSGVAVPHAVLGRDVGDGAFTVKVTRDALSLDGTAALAKVPVSVGATLSLADNPDVRLKANVTARLDGNGRRALGLDYFPDMVSGPVGVAITYQMTQGPNAEAQVWLDLGDAGIAIPPLGWTKAAGSAARAQATVALAGREITALRDVVISGGGLEAQLAAAFDGGGLQHLDLARLAVGATDAGAGLTRRADGGWHAVVSGNAFDATGLIDFLSRSAPSTAPEPAFDLDVKLDRVIVGPERVARGIKAHLVSDGPHWQSATADATLPGGAPVRLRYGAAGGGRHFSLRSDDFGGLVGLIGVAQNVRGGRIDISGTAIDDGPLRRLKLAAEGTNFRLVNAPMLAKLLSVASFSGIGGLVTGDGIPFSQLTAHVLYGTDRMNVEDFRTYGSVIGVNASGLVDWGTRTVELSGTLIPSFRLNTVLGSIPKIGNFLLGGSGEGLFGANFTIAGALDNPNISVNLLSALAPGALRNLFQSTPAPPAQ